MNFKWTLSLAAVMSIGVALQAQPTAADQAKRSEQILLKSKKLELANQILPLLLKKSQVDKLMAILEVTRAEMKKQEAEEFSFMLKIEPKIDGALKEAIDKQKVTTDEDRKEIGVTYRALGIKRDAVVNDHIDRVVAWMEKELNSGQRKAATNALRPNLYDNSIDASGWDDAKKMRFYAAIILLDRDAYGLLKEMRPKMPD